ncbi:hypothetical protein MJM95_28960, partial [Salmonella enterica subsp. enterica serovar Anatum]|nr:hypothetical protein [Salmonella enterica subsp. enterica serovar Anatum]
SIRELCTHDYQPENGYYVAPEQPGLGQELNDEVVKEYLAYVIMPDTLNLGYVSPAANLPLKPMVGKDLCVNIELDGGGKRHISGL